MPGSSLLEKHHIPPFIAVAFQVVYASIVHWQRVDLVKMDDAALPKWVVRLIPILYRQPILTVVLPIFLGVAFLFAFNFENAILTLLWVGLACLYIAVGLLVKSQRSIQIAMAALVFCSVRLILFDLIQSDMATRALVFIGVGSLMLGVSILYKKFEHRIENRKQLSPKGESFIVSAKAPPLSCGLLRTLHNQ
jgi:uncharacterized membrane protein